MYKFLHKINITNVTHLVAYCIGMWLIYLCALWVPDSWHCLNEARHRVILFVNMGRTCIVAKLESTFYIYTQIRLTGVMDGSPCRVRSELCQWIYLSLKQDEKTLQCTCLAKYTKEFHSLPKYYQQIKRLNLLLPKEFLLFVGLFFFLHSQRIRGTNIAQMRFLSLNVQVEHNG